MFFFIFVFIVLSRSASQSFYSMENDQHEESGRRRGKVVVEEAEIPIRYNERTIVHPQNKLSSMSQGSWGGHNTLHFSPFISAIR